MRNGPSAKNHGSSLRPLSTPPGSSQSTGHKSPFPTSLIERRNSVMSPRPTTNGCLSAPSYMLNGMSARHMMPPTPNSNNNNNPLPMSPTPSYASCTSPEPPMTPEPQMPPAGGGRHSLLLGYGKVIASRSCCYTVQCGYCLPLIQFFG